jgi:glycine hydroxymethyltransferase
MNDFLIRGSIRDLDPALDELISLESERQYRKIILIPSESSAPAAVRQALSAHFKIFMLKAIRTKNNTMVF